MRRSAKKKRKTDIVPRHFYCIPISFAAENTVLKEHPDALRVILYYDDLEACTLLGSYA